MKTAIQGLMGFLTLALLLCAVASYPARAEISCDINVLPENDVIDTDIWDFENHRLNLNSLTPREQWIQGHVRVMISTQHDDEYHKGKQWYKNQGNPVLYDYQTDDRKAIISVEVWVPAGDSNPNGNGNEKTRNDEIEGCPVWMLVIDPPDGSVYVKGTRDDNRDNRDHNTKHRGTLTVHDGFTATGDEIQLVWGEVPNQTKNTVGLGVKLKYARPETGVDGKDWKVYHAKAILEITDRFGGDNYQILASINQNPDKPDNSLLDANKNPFIGSRHYWYEWDCNNSGIMYAWKRCYLEVDKMFRAGHYLTADAVAGATVIQLADVNLLNNGDKIRIFDVDEAGEEAVITAIDAPNKRITIDTDPQTAGNQGLTKAYQKGANNNEAAVGKLVYNGGQLDEASTFFLVDTSGLAACYDPAFVEFVEYGDGERPVPYEAEIEYTEPAIRAFSQRWFKNKERRDEDLFALTPARGNNIDTGKPNYFHIITGSTIGGGYYGVANFSMNACYVLIGRIESVFAQADWINAKSDVVIHEIGHQFNTSRRDNIVHCGNDSYEVGVKCIMNEGRNRTNGKWRFCLNHILNGMNSPAIPPDEPAIIDPGIRDQRDGQLGQPSEHFGR